MAPFCPKRKQTKSARRFPTKQKISKQNTQIFKMPKYSKYANVEAVVVVAGQPPKKGTFKKFRFRGIDLDALLDMSTDDLVKLFTAKARRRFQRGLKRKPMALIKKLCKVAHLLKGMENSDGSSTMRNFTFKGRLLPLPPNTFDCIFPSDENCIANPTVRSEGYPKPMGGQCHQRTSSDSFLLEEQPSWLDELLNEPEIPVGRGHQRSSSDSFASLNGPAKSFREDRYKFKNNPEAGPSRGFSNFDHHKGLSQASLNANASTSHMHQNKARESSSTSVTSSSSSLFTSDGISLQTSGSSCTPQEPDGVPSKAIVKKDGKDPELSSFRSDCSHSNPTTSRADLKRAKQQFAQRSRLRKLQYIAEMERNIQVLQAEGYEVSAELEFLDQQNLILGMENMALKQRLESLSQERFIKHLEQDMLQKEVSRLQNLYQQQQQQQTHSKRHQINSTNLDSHNSIIPKEAGS